MAEYAGESLAKKVARVRLYTRVRETLLFSNRNLDNTKVLFLPGPDASEVGALKHILKVKPQNVIGVDIDGDACDALTKKWPETNVIQGDLSKPKTFNKALRDIKSYGEFDGFDFIHLDLMGILKRDSELLYGMWARFCAENGVMAVTYLRGRENKSRESENVRSLRKTAALIAKIHEGAGGESKLFLKMIAPDPERAISHLMALNTGFHKLRLVDEMDGDVDAAMEAFSDELNQAADMGEREGMKGVLEHRRMVGRTQFTLLASYAYRAETSPMGVMAAHHVSIDTLESDSYAFLRYKHGRHTSSVIKKDPMEDLLKEAELLEVNYGKDAMLEILNVTRQQLAAYRAHRTMGTYT
jgi:hypothetical protein